MMLAALILFLATTHALASGGAHTLLTCANGVCPAGVSASADEAAAAGTEFLQHNLELRSASAEEASWHLKLRRGRGQSPSIGFHYMMLLQRAGKDTMKDISYYIDKVSAFDTCFTEILVTLDYGVPVPGDDYNARLKIPGAALEFLNDSAVAQFFCEVKEQTRHLVSRLEQRCGGTVFARVHVLDLSLPHVREANYKIFGSYDLPHRMFKNTLAYLYGPAMMEADYIVHADDDVVIRRNGVGEATFVQQALHSFDNSNLASVSMPCCTCNELHADHSWLVEFNDSRQHNFLNLTAGQMDFQVVSPDRIWKVPGLDPARCGHMPNFMTMQAYILHASRFRAMFPMTVGGGVDPTAMATECLLTESAKRTTPPTVFGWLGDTGHCRDLRDGNDMGSPYTVRPSNSLDKCTASVASEAERD